MIEFLTIRTISPDTYRSPPLFNKVTFIEDTEANGWGAPPLEVQRLTSQGRQDLSLETILTRRLRVGADSTS